MTTLVVARYQEPLDWLDDVPSEWRIVVYDKSGDRPDGPDKHRTIRRPNVGREAETFLWHNVTAAPGGYTIYLQGNPFDHCPDPIGQAKFIMGRGDRVGWLGPHYDTAWNVEPHRLEDLPMEAVWNALFPFQPQPRRFSFPAGAQMVVWQSAISGRPYEFWLEAHELACIDDWRVAHCFERLWPTIYGAAA